MRFERLNVHHSESLLAFETENDQFFSRVIAPRDRQFLSSAGIKAHISQCVAEHCEKRSVFYVLVDEHRIVARANMRNINAQREAEIGYRVAEREIGRGIATHCVNHLIDTGRKKGLTALVAYVMDNSPVSEPVLVKNGFIRSKCLPHYYQHQQQVLDGFMYIR
jgi:ribosomal-protein-alanine N-acetyltransferase